MGAQTPTVTRTTTQTETAIQETTDYGMFKLLPHNRPVVQSHVIRLMRSMSERPHLRPARPVLCNDKMEIIDGQHREKAGELNGQSIYFMVVPGLTIDDARVLNALQRTWSMLDYAYSYASSKVSAYVQFVKTYEDRELPPSVVLEYMMSGHNTKSRDDFRIGMMLPVDQKALDQKLDQLEEILAKFPKAATLYIVAAAYRAAQANEAYDHTRMTKEITTAHPDVQPDRISYIRELERIYNADVPYNGPSYVRFFG